MQNIKETNIVELKPPDFDRPADLLTEAYYNNPAHVYICPHETTRAKLLKWALKANLKLNLAPPKAIGNSFALVEEGKPPGTRKIEAMAFWHPPQRESPGLTNKLKSSWFTRPWKFGKANYQRLAEVMTAFAQIEKKVLNGKQAWFLNNMAVAEELRGKGIGTKVLHQQLGLVVKPSGFPAILMTQREANVRFYQKLGFKVADESVIGKGEDAFINWCLVCHPEG